MYWMLLLYEGANIPQPQRGGGTRARCGTGLQPVLYGVWSRPIARCRDRCPLTSNGDRFLTGAALLCDRYILRTPNDWVSVIGLSQSQNSVVFIIVVNTIS